MKVLAALGEMTAPIFWTFHYGCSINYGKHRVNSVTFSQGYATIKTMSISPGNPISASGPVNGSSSGVISPEETLDITAALADPTRYGIYRAIVDAAGVALTVSEVAEQFSLHPNVARMHLQKLVDVGLVHADTRKSQGGGRPARIYSLSDRVASLQFPPRDYQLLASLALQIVDTIAEAEPEVLERVGVEMGREEGRRALRRDGLDPRHHTFAEMLDSFRSATASLGLFPRIDRDPDGTVRFEIRNCVFRELSARYPGLVCKLHTAVVRGLLEEYFSQFDLEAGPAIFAGDSTCLFTVHIPSAAEG